MRLIKEEDGASFFKFSSPLSGTFFQFYGGVEFPTCSPCFRPLSRGLFFNAKVYGPMIAFMLFSSPFSGTFFQFY